ncbi:MAG: C25 family cysteine peptidase [Thermodesulfobacteriota bacterium]|nr:C25 family cysteine peptidase [Thermodesulfobacteriota bacterium]
MERKALLGISIFIFLLSIGLFVASDAGSPPASTDPEVIAAFDELEEHINGLPDATLNVGQRTSLVMKLNNAEAAYVRGQPCTAANILRAYLNETQDLREGEQVAIAEELYNLGRALCATLLGSLPEAMICPGHEGFDSETSVEVQASDNQHLAASVSFGELRTLSVEAEGELYTQVVIPGMEFRSGIPGLPAVPVVHRLVAIPRGAEVTIQASPPTVSETIRLNLYPCQRPAPAPGPDDEVECEPGSYDCPAFVKDEEAYASEGPYPPEVCTVTPVGQYRDLQIAVVSIAAGQYYPLADTYVSHDSLEYELTFQGGSGAFVTEASESPFESQTVDFANVVINGEEVFDYVEDRPTLPPEPCDGEELLIITHEKFRAAADKLGKWKNDKGIVTNVVEANDTTTGDEIDQYIDGRYKECVVRPSYVLLLGDAEFIPTFYVETVFSKEAASDYRYAIYSDPTPDPTFLYDIFPDFGVGRIPVDTLEQANNVVDKIIQYESNPPSSASFYENISLAALFQCCQWLAPGYEGYDRKAYIETCEFVREELVDQGYTVERLYSKVNCNKTAYQGDETPRYYYQWDPLPEDIGPNSPFGWDASEEDIVDAFNAGRFLILHRDHGSEKGWAEPNFHKDTINDPNNGLSNGNLLPVVFSINCSSGFFDNETNPGEPPIDGRCYPTAVSGQTCYSGAGTMTETYFGERLLRKANGGAVGFIGATRDTPDTGDDVLTRGLFDAVWPNTVANYGGTTSLRRLGDILNYGKMYVFSEVGVTQMMGKPLYPLDISAIFSLFHVLGDPSLEMWTRKALLILSADYTLDILEHSLLVKYSVDGAQVTALQKTDNGMVPIGRATVKNGEATLTYVLEPEEDLPILLSVSMENEVSRLLTPEPIDLLDESSFSESAKRITFEEYFAGEPIDFQYLDLGVWFYKDEMIVSIPTIADAAMRDGASTKSGEYSLLHQQESPGLPLTMFFSSPVQRVGMYIGNAWDCIADVPMSTEATLRVYDGEGLFIASVTREGFCLDVDTFMGIDVGAQRISHVDVDYGDTASGEMIDDLLFE